MDITIKENDHMLVRNDEQSMPNKRKFGNDIKEPYLGMIFSSPYEAREYYEEFGRQQGYSIIKRSSYKNQRGPNVTSVLFSCSCQGKSVKRLEDDDDNQVRETSTIRSNCKASMRVSVDKMGTRWVVRLFSDEHNHKLISPTKRVHMKSTRKMPDAAKSLSEEFLRNKLQVNKVPKLFGIGLSSTFDDQDCYTHLKIAKRIKLLGGDAQETLNYFRKKQLENPLFYYAIQCDEDERATIFFWIDSQSRLAYHNFGDVVMFDLTYNTKKYSMPFAPFTGVNHHFQSILFGCALLQDESEESFVWLFKTWLDAMEGKHPTSIITDQDLAIMAAVAKAFPNTRHRFCLWHIRKKFNEKLPYVYSKGSKFKIAIKACLYQAFKTEDFEKEWTTIMIDFHLQDNEWLQSLFNIRSKWVPVFNRNRFFAGMNTTQRNESINSFFDAFVTSTTNLREFVEKYDQATDRIYVRERKEDFISIYKTRMSSTRTVLLYYAGTIYTKVVYVKFKREFDAISCFKVEEFGKDDDTSKYLVKTRKALPIVMKNEAWSYEEFVVTLNKETTQGKCSCQSFKFVGISCRHLVALFEHLYIDEIPSNFILKRWTKEANRCGMKVSECSRRSEHMSDSMKISDSISIHGREF